jgi:hypothetical protein
MYLFEKHSLAIINALKTKMKAGRRSRIRGRLSRRRGKVKHYTNIKISRL